MAGMYLMKLIAPPDNCLHRVFFAASAEFGLCRGAEAPVFSKDPRRRILTWNGGAKKMLGLQKARLAVETGVPWELRTVLTGKDRAPNPVLVTIAPMRDKYGRTRGVLCLGRHVVG
jgi:hypothetical protein